MAEVVVGTVVEGAAEEVELENGNVPECYGYLKSAISQNRFHMIRRDVLRRLKLEVEQLMLAEMRLEALLRLEALSLVDLWAALKSGVPMLPGPKSWKLELSGLESWHLLALLQLGFLLVHLKLEELERR